MVWLVSALVAEFGNLEVLRLNPRVIWYFDVVLSDSKVRLSSYDVLGIVGMFG